MPCMRFASTDGFEFRGSPCSVELLLTAPQGMYRVFAVTFSGSTGSVQWEEDYANFEYAKYHARGLVMDPEGDPRITARVFNDMGESVFDPHERPQS